MPLLKDTYSMLLSEFSTLKQSNILFTEKVNF